MSNEPPQDNAGDTTEFGPVWDAGQSQTPGDYVMLGDLPRPPGRSRKLVIGASIAAVAMLAGAGAAYAVSTSGAPQGAVTASSSGSSPSARPGHGPIWRCPKTKSAMCSSLHIRFPFRHIGGPVMPGGLFGGLIGGMLGAVHGQLVEAKPGGGYVTVNLQRGKVTAVSSSSITLRSPDGFSASYAVAGATVVGAQRAGLGSVKVGDQISLQATVKGSTATATSILDLTLLSKSHSSIGFGWSGSTGR